MKLVFPNLTEISAIATSSLEHTFLSLSMTDGGRYICTTTINIPTAGITDIQASAAKTLTVVCKLK